MASSLLSRRVVAVLVAAAAAALVLSPAQNASAQSAPTTATLSMSMPGDTTYVSEGIGEITFTITLDSAATTALNFTLLGNTEQTAQQGSDYTPTLSTVSIGVGESSGSGTFTIVDDNDVEGDETFLVHGSEVGALTTNIVTVTIKDNDEPALWSGNLAVKDLGSSAFGCDTTSTTTANKCSTTATLSDNSFSLGGTAYAVGQVKVSGGSLVLNLGNDNVPDALKGYTLHVGTASYPLGEATISSSSATWSSAPTWTATTGTVALSLKPTPPVWEATLNPQGTVVLGCSNTSTGQECSDTSNLTDDDFSYGGVTYAVPTVSAFTTGGTYIQFDKDVSTVLDKLSFCVGGSSLAFSSADHTTANTWAEWGSTNQSWSTGDEVYLSIAYSCAYASDTTLSGLTAGAAAGATGTYTDVTSLTPVFAPATTAYAYDVDYDKSHTRLTATAARTSASVRVGQAGALAAATSGAAGPAVALAAGENAVVVEVTAIDGSTGTYTVTVTRKGGVVFGRDLNPTFTYNVTVDEGAGTVQVPITVSALPASSMAVSVTARDITAEDGTDYTFGSAKTVTFSSTDSSKTKMVEFTVTDDTTDEIIEYLALTLSLVNVPYSIISSTSPGGESTEAFISIIDNDVATPSGKQFAITPSVTAAEGASAQLTVTLGENAPAGGVAFTVTPEFCTCGPTALTRGAVAADAGTVPATVTVPSGSATATLTVPLARDTLEENDEHFSVSIATAASGWSAAGTGAGRGHIIIQNADPVASTVSLSAAPNPVTEGSPVTVTATLSAALSADVTVPVTLAAGTAESGDYGTLSAITIGAGQTSGTATVTTSQDTDTDDETFTATLGAPLPSSVTAGAASSVTVIIRDDDAAQSTQTVYWQTRLQIDVDGQFYGCDDNNANLDNCDTAPALADNDFVFEGTTYTVEAFYLQFDTDTLRVVLDKTFPQNLRSGLVVYFRSTGYRVEADDYYTVTSTDDAFAVSDILYDPSDNQTLVVALGLPAVLGGVTLTAGGSALPLAPAVDPATGLYTTTGTVPASVTAVTVAPAWAEHSALLGVANAEVGSQSPDGQFLTQLGDVARGATKDVTLAATGETYVWVTFSDGVGASPQQYRITVFKALGAPENLAVAGIEAGLGVSWTAVSGATGYRVDYKAAGAGSWTTSRSGGTATTHSIGGLTNGVSYDVRVRASNARGDGPWATAAGAAGLLLPKHVRFSSSSYTVAESGGQVIVTLETAAAPAAFTAVVRHYDGSAKAGSDFTGGPWQLHFQTGDTAANIVIPITADDDGEGNEYFTLGIESSPGTPDYYLARPSSATVTITDKPINAHPYKLELTPGGHDGYGNAQIAATWRREPGAGGYYLQYWEAGRDRHDNWESRWHVAVGGSTTTATLPAAIPSGGPASAEVVGPRMKNGKQYWVRMGAIRANGQVQWAQAVKAIAGAPVPGLTAVEPGAAGGAATLTVSWRRDGRFDGYGGYGDDVIQIIVMPDVMTPDQKDKNGNDYWPQRATTHSLPSGVVQVGAMTDVAGRRSVTFSGFAPGEQYLVRMHSVMDGEPAAIDSSGFTRAAMWSVPGAPQGLRASGGEAQLRASWWPPRRPSSGDAPVSGQQVQYKLRNAPDAAAATPGDPATGWVTYWVNNAARCARITDRWEDGVHHPVPDGTYDLRVRASNGLGAGPWATTFAATLAAEQTPACGDAGGRPNHSPAFSEGAAAGRALPADAVRGQSVGGPVEARDPDGDRITYRLSGPDAESFAINARSGQMRTSVSFPGAGAQAAYSVIVAASDGRHASGDGNHDGADARIKITITDASAPPGTPIGEQEPNEPQPADQQPADQQPAEPPTPGQTEPFNIRVTPGDATLTVTWTVAPRHGVADDQIRHALRWSQTPGVWNNPRDPLNVGPNDGITVNGGVTTYTITGLTNGVVTGVHVRSYTGEDDHTETAASSSKWVKIKGTQTTPTALTQPEPQQQQPEPEPEPQQQQADTAETPGPVLNLQVTLSADGVTVSWETPQTGGTPASYIVRLKPADGGKDKVKEPKAPNTSVTFANPAAGETYEVKVRARNEAGKGDPVRSSVTVPELPGKAVNLQLSATTDSLTATWEAPQTGGTPAGYLLNIKNTHSGKDQYRSVAADATAATFGGLEAAAPYRVWIRAVNAAGKSNKTRASITLPAPEPEAVPETVPEPEQESQPQQQAETVTGVTVAAVTVTPATLSVSEDGTATYTMVLHSRPTADVTVTATSSDTAAAAVTATSTDDDAAAVSPTSHTFTPDDWDTPRTFTVTGVPDDDRFDESVTVTHDVTSTDTDYDAIAADPVAVTVTDTTPAPPEPADTHNAWHPYDTDNSGCIDSNEYLVAVRDYTAANISTATVLAVVRNRC